MINEKLNCRLSRAIDDTDVADVELVAARASSETASAEAPASHRPRTNRRRSAELGRLLTVLYDQKHELLVTVEQASCEARDRVALRG